MTPAQWGRTSPGGSPCYTSSGPEGRRRALVAATAFQKKSEKEPWAWDNRVFKVSVKGRMWFWLGCAWDFDQSGNPQFELLTNPANPDPLASSTATR